VATRQENDQLQLEALDSPLFEKRSAPHLDMELTQILRHQLPGFPLICFWHPRNQTLDVVHVDVLALLRVGVSQKGGHER